MLVLCDWEEIENRRYEIDKHINYIITSNQKDVEENSLKFRILIVQYFKGVLRNGINFKINVCDKNDLKFVLVERFANGTVKHCQFEYDVQKVSRKLKIESLEL